MTCLSPTQILHTDSLSRYNTTKTPSFFICFCPYNTLSSKKLEDMERGCLEEGLPTRPLLLDSKEYMNSIIRSNTATSSSSTGSSDSSITCVLVFSTFVAVCGSFCYGCAVGFSSPAQSGIMEELGLSVAAYSVFGSTLTMGGMMSAVLSGKITDLIGRRRTMWLSQLFCTPGWLAVSFAKDALLLDIGRLATGFGVGLITYVVPVYVAEIAPKNHRGRFAAANLLMINCGFGLIYFLGNIMSWRYLSLTVAIPCLIQVVGLFFIPESPRWLAKFGREKEFKATLLQLRGKEADIFQEAQDINNTIELFQDIPEATPLELFQKRYAYPVIVGVGLMLLQQFGGNSGMAYYVKTIFSDANFSPTIGTTALAIMQIPAAITSLLLMDLFPRRTLLMVSAAGGSLTLILLGLSFFLQELGYAKELTPTMVFIALLVHSAAFAMGMGGIPWIIMSEIFPVNLKASGGSLVTLTNWFCSWIVTYTFNFIMEWSSAGTFFIFAAISAFTIVFVWKLVPETKGKTLEEIQATITSSSQEVY